MADEDEIEKSSEDKTDIEKKEAIERLTEIPAVGKSRAEKLYEKGFDGPEDIVEEGMSGLAGIYQIGFKTAKEILEGAAKIQEEKVEEEEDILEEITKDITELESFLDKEDKKKKEEEKEHKDEETEEPEDELDEEIEKKEVEEKEEREKEDTTEKEPKSIIKKTEKEIGKEKQEMQITELIPVFSSFLIPTFFMFFVGLEFIMVLLAYPSAYPVQSLYYLTPLPYLEPSWISSLTLSFLTVSGLFLTTWKGYDFSNEFKLKKKMIAISVIFTGTICFSLGLHIYYSEAYPGKILTYVLLGLALFSLITQGELLRRKNLTF